MTDTILLEMDHNPLSSDDAELIRSAQLSLAGFKALYLKWLTPVYRYFHYRVGNAKDAEDLTSQVFLKVYEELPHYRERGNFPAWLFTIVRHTAVDFFRTQKPTLSLDSPDTPSLPGDLLAQAVHSDEIERLGKLIQTLPENDQDLIRLRFVAELSYREIGALFNRKEDAVRKSISRLLARLQSQLETQHE